MKGVVNYLGGYFPLLIALVRGTFYIVYYRIFKRNVKIEFPLIAYHKLQIKGPGSVSIGKRCVVAENVFRGLSIITFSKNSKVTIGDRGLLAGLTIRCHNYVSIGNDIMTAVSLVQDTLIVNLSEYRHKNNENESVTRSENIEIGNNVWLGGHSNIIGGSIIGNDSVISAGAVCYKNEVKEYCLGSGNPVKRALPIEQVLALRK